jgi:hypothetical protein
MIFSDFLYEANHFLWREFDPTKERGIGITILFIFLIAIPIIGCLILLFKSKQILFWEFSKHKISLENTRKKKKNLIGRIQLYLILFSISYTGCIQMCGVGMNDRLEKRDPFQMEVFPNQNKIRFSQSNESLEIPLSDLVGISMKRDRHETNVKDSNKQTMSKYSFEFYLVDRTNMEILVFTSGKEFDPNGKEAREEFENRIGKSLPKRLIPEIVKEEGTYFRPTFKNAFDKSVGVNSIQEKFNGLVIEKSWESDISGNLILLLFGFSGFLLIMIFFDSFLYTYTSEDNDTKFGLIIVLLLKGILISVIIVKYEIKGTHHIKISNSTFEYKKIESEKIVLHKQFQISDIHDYSWDWKTDEIYLSTVEPKSSKTKSENGSIRYEYDILVEENKNLYYRWDKEKDNLLAIELYRFKPSRLEMIGLYRELINKIQSQKLNGDLDY